MFMIRDVDFVMPGEQQTTLHLLGSVSFCLIGYAICWLFCAPGGYKKSDYKQDSTTKLPCRIHLADTYFSAFFYPLVSILAFDATFHLGSLGTPEGRWHTVTFSSYWFCILYIGGNFAHLPITLLKNQKNSFKLQMLAHHALSITCFYRISYSGIGHFYAAFDGCCEVCTFLLNNIFLFKELGLAKASFNDHKGMVTGANIIAFNGVLLWLSYVFFRLLLFPIWLCMFFKDWVMYPEVSYTPLTNLERVLFPGTTIVLLILSSIWMVPITKGLIKALQSSGGDMERALDDAPISSKKQD